MFTFCLFYRTWMMASMKATWYTVDSWCQSHTTPMLAVTCTETYRCTNKGGKEEGCRLVSQLWWQLYWSLWAMQGQTHWNPTCLRRMTSDEVRTPISLSTPCLSSGKAPVRDVIAISSVTFGWSPVHHFEREISGKAALWSVFSHFLDAFLHQKSNVMDKWDFSVFDMDLHSSSLVVY